MAIFNFRKQKQEQRTITTQDYPIGGLFDIGKTTVVPVDIESALGVPAIWAAVNFLSGTIASLPLHVYKRTDESDERYKGTVSKVLNNIANEEMSSFEWRKYSFEQVFTGGRSISYIERNSNGDILNIFPIDPNGVSIQRTGHVKTYQVSVGKGDQQTTKTYNSKDIIDVPFMLKSDGLTVRGPIATNKQAIAMVIAASDYGSKAFQSGGIPPAVLQGPFQSGAGAQRAADDIHNAMKKATEENKPLVAMPTGHELKVLGFNSSEMQLLELQRFSIEQIARIYQLPPVFLQDLTHGTYSNTEQQDLAFVKHTLNRWVSQFESELNLKLFGRENKENLYCKFNLDGLLRGDLKSRMEAHAMAINTGIRTPNEVRIKENLPAKDEGNQLMIQGATVPIASQGQMTEAQRSQMETDQAVRKALND